jgi:hypothetical protein
MIWPLDLAWATASVYAGRHAGVGVVAKSGAANPNLKIWQEQPAAAEAPHTPPQGER